MRKGLTWRVIPWGKVDWEALDRFADRTVFQTPAWMQFIAETQNGTPVVAELSDGVRTVAFFSGVVTKKFGVKILGSPFPGWTTAYMGFNTNSQADRMAALEALPDLAFKRLGCMHLEVMDAGIAFDPQPPDRYSARRHYTFQTDLSVSEDELFGRMTSACRRCIRKAEKVGVVIEECNGADTETLHQFAAEYYRQLEDVFAKDGLVPTYGLDRVEALIRHLRGTDDLLLVRAIDPDGRCIGSSIYVGKNDLVYFWGNASYRDGQINRPNEALHWFAMRYWKARGIRIFDWGGGGEYKLKYGVRRVDIPWLRRSRYPAFEVLRSGAQRAFAMRQRFAGALRG